MRGLVLIWLVGAISFTLGWMSHSVVIRRKVMSFPAERPQTEISLVIDPPEATGGERQSGPRSDPLPRGHSVVAAGARPRSGERTAR